MTDQPQWLIDHEQRIAQREHLISLRTEIVASGLQDEFRDHLQVTDDRIKQAIDNAEDAFWAQITRHFPEVETGDFGPSLEWFESLVRLWLHCNHPYLRERTDNGSPMD